MIWLKLRHHTCRVNWGNVKNKKQNNFFESSQALVSQSIIQRGSFHVEVSWEISLCVTCCFTQLSSLTAQLRHHVFHCSARTTLHPFSLYRWITSQGNTWLSSQRCVLSRSHFPHCIASYHWQQERFCEVLEISLPWAELSFCYCKIAMYS